MKYLEYAFFALAIAIAGYAYMQPANAFGKLECFPAAPGLEQACAAFYGVTETKAEHREFNSNLREVAKTETPDDDDDSGDDNGNDDDNGDGNGHGHGHGHGDHGKGHGKGHDKGKGKGHDKNDHNGRHDNDGKGRGIGANK